MAELSFGRNSDYAIDYGAQCDDCGDFVLNRVWALFMFGARYLCPDCMEVYNAMTFEEQVELQRRWQPIKETGQ